jgi:hypothetical protein
MPINVQISIDLGPRQKRMLRAALVAGGVIGALGLGVAIAAPAHTFTARTPISASQMNDNFVDLDARLTGIVPAGGTALATSAASHEYLQRVTFSGGGNTDCTTALCTVLSQSGAWTSNVSRVSTGSYSININTGTFSAPPSCVCSATNTTNNNVACAFFVADASSTLVSVRTSNGGVAVDGEVSLLCMGPH